MRVGIGFLLFVMFIGMVPRFRTNGDLPSPPLPRQECTSKKCG